MTQNNSTELSGYSFLDLYNKNAHPVALDPKSATFQTLIGLIGKIDNWLMPFINRLMPRIIWQCHKTPKHLGLHSLPPSSLDRGSIEFILSPKKLVGCRGGSRNADGCWGFPYLKIKKFVGFTKFPFHVFDRYEIHIQDFWEFIWPCFIIFRSSTSQTLITLGTKNKKLDTHI